MKFYIDRRMLDAGDNAGGGGVETVLGDLKVTIESSR